MRHRPQLALPSRKPDCLFQSTGSAPWTVAWLAGWRMNSAWVDIVRKGRNWTLFISCKNFRFLLSFSTSLVSFTLCFLPFCQGCITISSPWCLVCLSSCIYYIYVCFPIGSPWSPYRSLVLHCQLQLDILTYASTISSKLV